MRQKSKRVHRGSSVIDRALTQTQATAMAKTRQPSRSRITPGSSLVNVLDKTLTNTTQNSKSIDKKKVRQSIKSIASMNSKQSTTDESNVSSEFDQLFNSLSFPNSFFSYFHRQPSKTNSYNPPDPSPSTRSASASQVR